MSYRLRLSGTEDSILCCVPVCRFSRSFALLGACVLRFSAGFRICCCQEVCPAAGCSCITANQVCPANRFHLFSAADGFCRVLHNAWCCAAFLGVCPGCLGSESDRIPDVSVPSLVSDAYLFAAMVFMAVWRSLIRRVCFCREAVLGCVFLLSGVFVLLLSFFQIRFSFLFYCVLF